MDRNEIITVVALALFVALLVAVWWISRGRSRPSGSASAGFAGIAEELFNPGAAAAREVRQIERELPAAAPDADPRDPSLRSGRTVSDLGAAGDRELT